MTQKTKTTKKTTAAKTAKSPKVAAAKTTALKAKVAPKKKASLVKKPAAEAIATPVPCPSTFNDVRNAILIVSLLINLFFLVAWIMLQVTTQYDIAVSQLLFTR